MRRRKTKRKRGETAKRIKGREEIREGVNMNKQRVI